MPHFALPRAVPEFLSQLEANNTRDWFEAHRAEYQALWLKPALDLAAALSGPAARMGLMAVPKLNASVRRINRDVRFSPDKRPYHTHLHLILSTGPAFNKAPGVHLLINARGIGFGAGIYGLSPDQLSGYREKICTEDGRAEFQDLLARAATVGAVLDAPDLARVPKGFSPADWDGLIRRKSVIVRTAGDLPHPEWLFGPDVVEGFCAIVAALAPLALWLVPIAKS